MRCITRLSFSIVLGLSLLLPLVSGCSSKDSNSSPAPIEGSPSQGIPSEDVVVTIGNLSDFTGVAASSMSIISVALEDMVEYFNDENLIPGVEVEVVNYDNQFDPAKDISGYEYLRHKDADLIWTPVPGSAITLKPVADQDQFLIICASVDIDELFHRDMFSALAMFPNMMLTHYLHGLPKTTGITKP